MEPVPSAGGIVLGDAGTVAVIRHIDGDRAWGFPKGHVDPGESLEDAARREIEEESGLTGLEFLGELGSYRRYRGDAAPSAGVELKEIHMYLFAAPPRASLAPANEVDEARWVPLKAVVDLLTYPSDRAWFTTVFERVRQAIQRD